ncbi:hypothetical protein N7481_007361 [Penicillium waksmanii]|uniref:uncharacterized protein n=1 Tax=Penicillium waksmanii TaxID=69791 RepID=UPI002548B32B|nr:uncharacterized protein N7481_007361 [Penicillium waksmanii]KAJ5980063.1 hypothetical protein N7481_007361 [Penicillium waksmanii]
MELGTFIDPLLFILGFVFSILSQLLSYLLSLLGFLVSPLIYIAHGLLSIALWPLRLLLKFEAFILFTSGAVFTGFVVGLCLYLTGDALTQLLHLYPLPQSSDSTELVPPKEEPYDWEAKIKDERFMSSTILEEEETSQVSE